MYLAELNLYVSEWLTDSRDRVVIRMYWVYARYCPSSGLRRTDGVGLFISQPKQASFTDLAGLSGIWYRGRGNQPRTEVN